MFRKYFKEIPVIKSALAPFKAFIKRKAQDHIPYDYLVPAGPYQEQWSRKMSQHLDKDKVYL